MHTLYFVSNIHSTRIGYIIRNPGSVKNIQFRNYSKSYIWPRKWRVKDQSSKKWRNFRIFFRKNEHVRSRLDLMIIELTIAVNVGLSWFGHFWPKIGSFLEQSQFLRKNEVTFIFARYLTLNFVIMFGCHWWIIWHELAFKVFEIMKMTLTWVLVTIVEEF